MGVGAHTLLRSLLFYTRVNVRVLAEFLFLRVQQWGRNAPGNGAGAPSTAPSVLEGWEGQTEHPGKVHCAPCEWALIVPHSRSASNALGLSGAFTQHCPNLSSGSLLCADGFYGSWRLCLCRRSSRVTEGAKARLWEPQSCGKWQTKEHKPHLHLCKCTDRRYRHFPLTGIYFPVFLVFCSLLTAQSSLSRSLSPPQPCYR